MDSDLDAIENSLREIVRTMYRPRYWSYVQQSARISLDRPSAYLLCLISSSAVGCSLHELAAKIGVEAPSITRMVNRLEDVQLIERIKGIKDKRITYIKPTDEGHQVVRAIQTAKHSFMKLLFEAWTIEDRTTLVQLLEKFANDISSPSTQY